MSISQQKPIESKKPGRAGTVGKQARFGEFLRNRRLEFGLGQKDVAAGLGFDVTRISKYEMGHSVPELPMLKRMADYYEVPIMTLIDLVEY